MSQSFHEKFLQDIAEDYKKRKGMSVIACYFRNQLNQSRRLLEAEQGVFHDTSGRGKRRNAEHHPYIEIKSLLLKYEKQGMECGELNDFLNTIRHYAGNPKIHAYDRKELKVLLLELQEHRDDADYGIKLRKLADRTAECYVDLDVRNFLYDAVKVRKASAGDIRKKTFSVDLLDMWFAENPSKEAESDQGSDRLTEYLDVFEVVQEAELTHAVIPLQIDGSSGYGFYIIGKDYLVGWPRTNRGRETVELILDGDPACFAIVSFRNARVHTKAGEKYWAPYSVADDHYEVPPRNVLFHGDEKGLQLGLRQYEGIVKESNVFALYRRENRIKDPEAIQFMKDFMNVKYQKYFLQSTFEEEVAAKAADLKTKLG